MYEILRQIQLLYSTFFLTLDQAGSIDLSVKNIYNNNNDSNERFSYLYSRLSLAKSMVHFFLAKYVVHYLQLMVHYL